MANPVISVKIAGIEELNIRFKGASAVINKHSRVAMQQSVKTVEGAVRPLTPVGVSGMLRNSIASEVIGVGSNMIGKVGSTLRDEVYPAVMEFGRKPGKAPPPGALDRWVHLVLKVPEEEVRRVSFLVGRSIARKGIKGKFFLSKGFETSKPAIRGYFSSAISAIVAELGGKL